MSPVKVLKNLILRHRYQLTLTYILFSLETLGTLLRPFFLGLAVNDLIKGSYRWLIILSVIHLVWLIIGTIRHRLDTRTYSAIYNAIVLRFLLAPYQQADVSKLSAHSNLAREFVDFLEYDIVYIIEAIYNLIGALILLLFYDSSVALICLGILLPVVGLSYLYGKKMRNLTRHQNDELEKQVDIIYTQDQDLIKDHYESLRKWRIRISDQEAWNFGIMEVLVMVVITISLLVSTTIPGPQILVGDVIGIYSYILKFVSGLDTIPYIVQKFSSLNDITKRIKTISSSS